MPCGPRAGVLLGREQLGDGTTTDRLTAVEVPSFSFNIDPAVTLDASGRVATVTTLIDCPAERWVQLRLSLSQGEAVGIGRTVKACTRQLDDYPVKVRARDSTVFEPGVAAVEAEVNVWFRGNIVDTQMWTREVELDAASDEEEPQEIEEADEVEAAEVHTKFAP